jgi:hypothetical protein
MSDEDRLVITAPHTGSWSTADQILSSALHGEALLMARRPELRPLIDQLAEQTQGRDDISLECAGVIARSRFAGSARQGEDYETKIRRLGRREGRLPVSHQTTRKEEDRTRTPAPMITNYGCPTSVWVFWVGFVGWVPQENARRNCGPPRQIDQIAVCLRKAPPASVSALAEG